MIESKPLTVPPPDLATFVPMDRRLALAEQRNLPESTVGAALFADVSGFTPLMETLVQELGRRRGAEEVLRRINPIYDALIAELHGYAGSVIGFAGDAITCWLDEAQGPAVARAVACALAMQAAMRPFSELCTPAGTPIPTGVKIAIAAGPVHRYLVGDPQIQVHEALAGATLRQMAAAERLAGKGEIIINEAGARQLGPRLQLAGWRRDPAGGARFGLITGLNETVAARPWPEAAALRLSPQQVRPWLPKIIFQQLRERRGWLGGFRSVTALFLRFEGIDFDQGATAHGRLDAYVRWVQAAVDRHEATLELTIGDKGAYIYAAFGTPIAHANDSARAVETALQLQESPVIFPFLRPVQIGITRGEVWTGACGATQRQTYGVMGNEVNLSARLMSQAQPGHILATERVARAANGQYRFQRLGQIQVKGRTERLPVTRLAGRSPTTIPHLSELYDGALVGRGTELAQMLAAVDAISAGEQRIIMLEGEAGIGKSRLIAAFAGHTHARGLLGFMGAGQSIEQQAPYFAWRDIMNSFLGLDQLEESDRPAQARRRVAELGPTWQPRLPLLNDLLSLGFAENEFTRALTPELRQLNLFRLVEKLLRDWSERQLLLLVLEDAQWLDPLSWELTVFLAGRLPQLPGGALLLMALRPPAGGHDWQARADTLLALPQTIRIQLPALARTAVETIIAARLNTPVQSLPAPLLSFVCQKAEGNPFYAEELTLNLQEQGILHVNAGQAHPVRFQGSLNQIERGLPETLQGLVQARLDRLPPTQQLILKIASVIGHRFEFPPLQAALEQFPPLSSVDLQAELIDIARQGLLQIGQPNPHPVYAFKQIVIQEAAYHSLLFAQRRQLHRTLARWYEKTYGGGWAARRGGPMPPELAPYLPLLVYHYRHAEIEEREQVYARAAGAQAAAQFANEDAIAYFTRALALTIDSDHASQYEILLAREQVYHLLGAREAQAGDLSRLSALALALGDNARQAQVALRRARHAEALSNFPAARAAAEQALALAQAGQLAQLEAQAHVAWADAHWRQGGYGKAQAYYEKGLALLKAVGVATPTIARVHKGLGIVNDLQGHYQAAQFHYHEAFRLSQANDDRQEMAASCMNLGNLAYSQNHFHEAQAQYQRALQMYRDVGEREGEAKTLNNLASLLASIGEFEQSQIYYRQSLGIDREIGNRHGEAMVLSNLANVLALSGAEEQARALYEASLELYRAVGDRRGEAYSLHNLGLLQISAGEEAAAETNLTRSQALRQALNQPHLVSESCAELARLAWIRGDDTQSRAYLQTVLDHLAENPALSGTEHTFRIFRVCFEVLHGLGDKRAPALLQAGYELLQDQAAQIPDAGQRRSFLQAVPAHRDLQETYAAWQQAGVDAQTA